MGAACCGVARVQLLSDVADSVVPGACKGAVARGQIVLTVCNGAASSGREHCTLSPTMANTRGTKRALEEPTPSNPDKRLCGVEGQDTPQHAATQVPLHSLPAPYAGVNGTLRQLHVARMQRRARAAQAEAGQVEQPSLRVRVRLAGAAGAYISPSGSQPRLQSPSWAAPAGVTGAGPGQRFAGVAQAQSLPNPTGTAAEQFPLHHTHNGMDALGRPNALPSQGFVAHARSSDSGLVRGSGRIGGFKRQRDTGL